MLRPISGVQCESICDRGRFGADCQNYCDCEHGSSCEPQSGKTAMPAKKMRQISFGQKSAGRGGRRERRKGGEGGKSTTWFQFKSFFSSSETSHVKILTEITRNRLESLISGVSSALTRKYEKKPECSDFDFFDLFFLSDADSDFDLEVVYPADEMSPSWKFPFFRIDFWA